MNAQQKQDQHFRTFRTLTGETRKIAIRTELSAEPHNIDFSADPFTLYNSQRIVLADMAKAVGYRKPITSYFSLGAAFFVYLAKGRNDALVKRTPGKRWSNHGIVGRV